jgi:hypothetical protein
MTQADNNGTPTVCVLEVIPIEYTFLLGNKIILFN